MKTFHCLFSPSHQEIKKELSIYCNIKLILTAWPEHININNFMDVFWGNQVFKSFLTCPIFVTGIQVLAVKNIVAKLDPDRSVNVKAIWSIYISLSSPEKKNEENWPN